MISEFTRRWCQALCVEKAIEMEIERLGEKAAIMKQRPLTTQEMKRDSERRAEAGRLIEIAQQPVEPDHKDTAAPEAPAEPRQLSFL